MHRLLGKVVKKELQERYRGGNGLFYKKYKLRVEILGSALGALSVPKGVVGREIGLVREFLSPWAVKRGDLLVLDSAESARILCPRRVRLAREFAPAGATYRLSADADRDGYAEDILASCFLRAVFQPHRGARLLSLVAASGSDCMAVPFERTRGGKYIMLGGAEEYIVEGGSPGEIWKSQFERDESGAADQAAVIYKRKLKSPEGVALWKRVFVEPDMPGVFQHCRVSYAGRPGEPGAGAGGDSEEAHDAVEKPDQTAITFGVALTPSITGPADSANVFSVPRSDGLVTERYHRPPFGRRWRWRDWRHNHFGMRPGFVLVHNEARSDALALFFKPEKAHVIVRSQFASPELALQHGTRLVRKGGRLEYGFGFFVSDAHAVTNSSLLLLARGAGVGARIPVAVTVRTRHRVENVRATITSRGRRRSVTLGRRPIPAAGAVFAKVVELGRSSFPVLCSVSVGGERLSCGIALP